MPKSIKHIEHVHRCYCNCYYYRHYMFHKLTNNNLFFFFSLQESCQNYIRILTITTPGSLLACGTNAFRPMCHYYNVTGNKYHLEKAKPGQALCPYGPKHNSTSVFVGELISLRKLNLIRKLRLALCSLIPEQLRAAMGDWNKNHELIK